MGALHRLFQRTPRREEAAALYAAIVTQSRLPVFFIDFGVPDTLDGRFDMVVMHTFLVLSRLKQEGEDGKGLAQGVFDEMFEDMDRGLRHLGSSDVRVGKRIKAMAQAFYGRAQAYEEGLARDDNALAQAVRRNVFGGADGTGAAAAVIATYLRRESEALARFEKGQMLAGRVEFGEPPAPAPAGTQTVEIDRPAAGP